MPQPLKPEALSAGDSVRVLSLSSPVEESRVEAGLRRTCAPRLHPKFDPGQSSRAESFFAGTAADRGTALKEALAETGTRAIFCSRGGYGSNYLLDGLSVALATPKILVGYSDITSLQIFLWQKFGWVTFYGPMVASGFDNGAESPNGYDGESLTARAHRDQERLDASSSRGTEAVVPGSARGHSSRRLPHAGRNDARHSLGTRHPRRDSGSRRSRHEALPSRSRAHASETSRQTSRCRRHHPRRFSGVRRVRREAKR